MNYSILEPIVLLYERTGERKFLNFAQAIVASWSHPGKFDEQGVRYIEQAESGEALTRSDALHAYTLMSCFEGLAELYRATGEKRYLDATLTFANCVERQELMIHGSVSNQELWCNGAVQQTQMLEKPAETCATVTWIKLCNQLLRLTGDPHWADQAEQSLYNGLLGAMMPHGEWWAYDSALMGERVPSRQQATDCELSCCVANGPRGLLVTPQWAVMTDSTGIVVNLYCEGTATHRLASGKQVRLKQSTDYPADGHVTLSIESDEPATFSIRLRIPHWSQQTVLKVNEEAIACKAGTYACIDREWKSGDTISLDLDFRGRVIPAPGGGPFQAIMCGPIVLACDSRLLPPRTQTLWLIPDAPARIAESTTPYYKGYVSPAFNAPPGDKPSYIVLRQVPSKDPAIWMTFEVPFVLRPSHYGGHRVEKVVMCDFASAGNQWSPDNLYRTWLPHPMFLGQLYPRDT